MMYEKMTGNHESNETMFFDFAFKNNHLVGIRKLTEEEHNGIIEREKAEELAEIERNRKLTFREKAERWVMTHVTTSRLAGCAMIMLGTILALLDMGEGMIFAGLGVCALLVKLPENS